jgi:hypothetical protein
MIISNATPTNCGISFLQTVGYFFYLVDDEAKSFDEMVIFLEFLHIKDGRQDLRVVYNRVINLVDKRNKIILRFEDGPNIIGFK